MRLCDNSCPAFFTNDGVCDDGGEGSRWNNCGQLGTDCADCGERWLGGPDFIDAGEPVEYTHNTTLQVVAAVITIVFLLFWGGLCLFVAWRGFGKTKAQAEEVLRRHGMSAGQSGGLASKDEAAEDAERRRIADVHPW